LDRKDNGGNYSCGHCDDCRDNGWAMNCRWSTREEQGSNMRANVFIVHNGRSATIPQWARSVGMLPATLTTRVRQRGWSFERAISTPVAHKKARS
jgi:hypothetical protein